MSETPTPGVAGALPRIAKGKRPQYFADPATDKLLAMVVTLMSELSITRDRLDSVERLLERHGVFDQAEVERFRPEGEAAAAREQRRAASTARVLRMLEAELNEALGPDAPRSHEELAREFGSETPATDADVPTPLRPAEKGS